MRSRGTCECGGSRWFGSDPPPLCAECTVCRTGPGGSTPEPHDFVARPVETDDGPATLSRCRYCYLTLGEMARRKANREAAQ